MTTVNVRTLKNKLSEYLDRASKGDSVAVTRNGKAVAWLVPADATAGEAERGLRKLVAQGTLRPPSKSGPWPKRRPLRIKGTKLVSEMMLEDRRSRY